jgi:cytochrome oxidase Cu insertion factor (SCO1/SenC/PrrC family)
MKTTSMRMLGLEGAWLVRLLLTALCLASTGSWASDGIYGLNAVWQNDKGLDCKLSDWANKPMVITMAYGTCRKVCSNSIRRMAQAQALADAQGVAIEFVVVSLDPEVDTPADWRAFRRAHKLDRPNWHFIRGSAKDTHTLARLLGIGYWVYDDHVVHDFRVLRTNRQGVITAALQAADEDPALLVQAERP